MKAKLVKKISTEVDQNNEQAKRILDQFYSDCERAEIVPAVD